MQLKNFLLNNKSFYDFVRALKYAGESSPLVYHCRRWTLNKFIRSFLKAIATPYCVMKYFHVKNSPNREGLAVVLIAKNETPYLDEWINFHVKQGVSHFIIYDNGSEDDLKGFLKKYIASGLVTYHVIKGQMRQIDAYNIAIAKYGSKFKYLAVIDADEFLFVRKNAVWGGGYNLFEFVDNFMNEHTNAGGIAVNWCVFGSNGHEKKPKGGVLENYTMRSENDFGPNHLVKTICDPQKVLAYVSAHIPIYRKGFHNLDENGGIMDGTVTEKVHFEKIRINHYFSKSREEFIAKRNRGMVAFVGKIDMSTFEQHDQNIIHDTEILERA